MENITKKNKLSTLTTAIDKVLQQNVQHLPILIVCIGTDRATGDAYGPLVGTLLKKKHQLKNYTILGTCDAPVHAQNLHEINTEGFFVIAIDACISETREKLYTICVDEKPLYPGAGVDKKLSAVGNGSIKAIVALTSKCVSTLVILQNVRLGFVLVLAELTAKVLCKSLTKYEKERNNICPETN